VAVDLMACDHDHKPSGGSSGTGFVWVCTHIVGPLIAIVAIMTWRWITGAPMLPRLDRGSTFLRGAAKPEDARIAWGWWPGYQRATTRMTGTIVVISALMWPIATGIAILTIAVIVTGVAVTARIRARRAEGPRIVAAVRAQPEQPTWSTMQQDREKASCAR
jgi:hypothetical protein